MTLVGDRAAAEAQVDVVLGFQHGGALEMAGSLRAMAASRAAGWMLQVLCLGVVLGASARNWAIGWGGCRPK